MHQAKEHPKVVPSAIYFFFGPQNSLQETR